MAEESKEKSLHIEQDVTCGLCSKMLRKPKQLSCCHVFCRECLEGYVKDTFNPESETIDCPKCQKGVDLPDGDTRELPSNYYILAKALPNLINVESGDLTCDFCKFPQKAVGYCLECCKNLCEADKEKHLRAEDTRSHHIVVLTEKNPSKIKKVSYCSKHTDSILKFYCCICQIPICADCKLAKHENHKTEDIADVANQDREKLKKLLGTLRQYLQRKSKSVIRAEKAEGNFKSHASNTIHVINHRREDVKAYIDRLCDKIVDYVRAKSQEELQSMVPILKDMKEDRNFIERSISTTEPVLELHGEDVKIVQVTKEVQTIVQHLPSLKSIDEKKFIFNAGTYGEPYMTRFVGNISLEAINISLEFSFESHLLDLSIIPVSETDAWISFYTSQEPRLSCISRGKEVNRYYMKSAVRAIQLGHDEFLLSSKDEEKLKVWKNYLQSDFAETPFAPRGLTKTTENTVLVCCSSISKLDGQWRSCIMEYTLRGELLRQIDSTQDDGKSLFTAPRYICVNINGNICVSDQHGHAVVIFNKDFRLVGRYEGQHNAQPFRPRGICCDRFGRIIVTDGDNNKVHLLTHSGEFIRYLLSEEDGVRGPALVALGPKNKLWVGCRDFVHVYSYLVEPELCH